MTSLKNFIAILLVSNLFIACKAQQANLINKIDEASADTQIDDSIINNLRSQNDLVIAYATENFAWAKTINYKILVQKNSEWKAYNYDVSLMKNNPSKNFSETTVTIDACNDLIMYLSKSQAWKIKGDDGSNFCTNGKTNCNINDAGSARLWIITKKTVFNPGYYAPEFFEKCCPDSNRNLFLSIKNKIISAAAFTQASTEQ